MAASLEFSAVRLFSFDKANPLQVQLSAGKIYKIESIGIAGSNGTVYLQNNDSPAPENIAILYTTIDDDPGAAMPFWLPPEFDGWLYNDSPYLCAVSVTEYNYIV